MHQRATELQTSGTLKYIIDTLKSRRDLVPSTAQHLVPLGAPPPGTSSASAPRPVARPAPRASLAIQDGPIDEDDADSADEAGTPSAAAAEEPDQKKAA